MLYADKVDSERVKMINTDCELCLLTKGETLPGVELILRNSEVLALLCTNGAHPGKWLEVTPLDHTSALVNLPQRVRDTLTPTVATLDSILLKEYGSTSHTIVASRNASGHISVHLIPVEAHLNIEDFKNLSVNVF